jgi:hypothetical protein
MSTRREKERLVGRRRRRSSSKQTLIMDETEGQGNIHLTLQHSMTLSVAEILPATRSAIIRRLTNV